MCFYPLPSTRSLCSPHITRIVPSPTWSSSITRALCHPRSFLTSHFVARIHTHGVPLLLTTCPCRSSDSFLILFPRFAPSLYLSSFSPPSFLAIHNLHPRRLVLNSHSNLSKPPHRPFPTTIRHKPCRQSNPPTMPASPDDDIFKRMFASFVARKTRNSAPNVQPPQPRPPPPPTLSRPSVPRSNAHAPPMYADRPAADTLRKVATDYNGRGFNMSSSTAYHASHPTNTPDLSPPLRTGHQSHHQRSSTARPDAPHHYHHNGHYHHAQHHARLSPFPSLFHSRPSQEPHASSHAHTTGAQASAAQAESRKHAASRSGARMFHAPNGPKGSRGSRGSKGSEKQVSASTEDAPPRKRTRMHALPTLQRSQSAHAGSLNSSRNSKGDKPRNNSRFNVPSGQHAPPSTVPPTGNTASANNSSSGAPSAQPQGRNGRSFPCDKCSAVFAQKGQLSRHIRRVHEKLRPHACEYCGRLFGARSDRTRHVLVRIALFFFCLM